MRAMKILRFLLPLVFLPAQVVRADAQAFWLFSEVEAHGVEVFSLLRESNLLAQSYLDVFNGTGYERTSYSEDP